MKIKGMPKATALCELERGQAFIHGDEVYIRMYEYVTEGDKCNKVNAFRLSWGKPVFIDWKTGVYPAELKAKLVEE